MTNAPTEMPFEARAVEPNVVIERITNCMTVFDRLAASLTDAQDITLEVEHLLQASDQRLETLGIRRDEVVHHTARRYGLID